VGENKSKPLETEKALLGSQVLMSSFHIIWRKTDLFYPDSKKFVAHLDDVDATQLSDRV
jgi:hypothetical protein